MKHIPNILSFIRLLMIPAFMISYFKFDTGYSETLIAAGIYALAWLTDALDGYLARRNNWITDLGKFLDPIADKLLVASVLFMIAIDGTIPNPWGLIVVTIIISRELIIDAFRLIASNKGIVLAADIWGKAKTMVQCWTMPLCILLAFFEQCTKVGGAGLLTFQVICYVLVGLSTVLTVISGVNYFVKNKQVISSK